MGELVINLEVEGEVVCVEGLDFDEGWDNEL